MDTAQHEGEHAGEEGVVWIVDDSPLEAEAARRALAGTFHNVLFADGSEMLEYLAAHDPPDVMVLDGKMPGISGAEVLRTLKSESTRRSKGPIWLLSDILRIAPCKLTRISAASAPDDWREVLSDPFRSVPGG